MAARKGFHLFIGQVFGQAVGQLEAGDAQDGLRDSITLLLQEQQKAVQQVNLEVNAGNGSASCQAVIHVIEDVRPFQVCELRYHALLTEKAPHLPMLAPVAAQVEIQPGGAPVFLLDALVTFQFTDQPGGQSLGVLGYIEGRDLAYFPQPAL
jgi:hypothetical protein